MRILVLTRRSLLRDTLAMGAGVLVIACSPAPAPTPTLAPAPAQPAEPLRTAAPASTVTPVSAKTTAAPTVVPARLTPATPTVAQARPAPAAPAKPATKKVVRWWMGSRGDDLKAFQVPTNAYMEKYPDVTIEVTSIADGGLTKVQAAIAAGDPPDLVMTADRGNTPGIYYKGGIQILDDYIKSDKGFDIRALNPVTVKGCQSFDGRQFALPDQDYIVSDFYYNTRMFREKGLDPARPPQTLEDLEKIAAMFEVRKGDQLVAVGFHPSAYHPSQTYAFAHGGEFFDFGKSRVSPDHPGVVAGLEWLARYYRKYGVDNLRRLQAGYGQYQSAQNALLAGQVAMIGFWDAMSAYRNRYAPTVEYDHTWFPYAANYPEAKGFGMLGFNPTWIPRGARERDAGWEVLKFNEMDPESALQAAILLSSTPHNLKAIELPGASQADPILRKCWNYAARGKMKYFPPTIPAAAEYNQEWSRQLDLILSGKQSVQDGVQKIIDVVQPLVERALKG